MSFSISPVLMVNGEAFLAMNIALGDLILVPTQRMSKSVDMQTITLFEQSSIVDVSVIRIDIKAHHILGVIMNWFVNRREMFVEMMISSSLILLGSAVASQD